MKKKEYKVPFIRVAEVKGCDILCGSIIDKGNAGGPDTPTQGGDGFIYGDSKRGRTFDDEWDD